MRTVIVIVIVSALSFSVAHAFGLGKMGLVFGKLGAPSKKGVGVVGATGFILMVDGASRILQTDGTSKVCRAGGC